MNSTVIATMIEVMEEITTSFDELARTPVDMLVLVCPTCSDPVTIIEGNDYGKVVEQRSAEQCGPCERERRREGERRKVTRMEVPRRKGQRRESGRGET